VDRTLVLTDEQLTEVKAIRDQICESLETASEYTYDPDERRGKAGSFADEVWEEALRLLVGLGCSVSRAGDLIAVRKPRA